MVFNGSVGCTGKEIGGKGQGKWNRGAGAAQARSTKQNEGAGGMLLCRQPASKACKPGGKHNKCTMPSRLQTLEPARRAEVGPRA